MDKYFNLKLFSNSFFIATSKNGHKNIIGIQRFDFNSIRIELFPTDWNSYLTDTFFDPYLHQGSTPLREGFLSL